MNMSLLQGLLVFALCNSAFAIETGESANSNDSVVSNQEIFSPDVIAVARWAMRSRDNGHLPFAIIDKINARVFVFAADGRLLGADAALLGMGRGDKYDAGIRGRKMADIKPDDRITPAGRFPVSLQRDSNGKEVLLIDYDAAIALHPVVKGTPAERRAERLNSASAQDNRISYGCINVPLQFYQKIVSPAFTKTHGVVYILPETSSVNRWFGFPAEGETQ